MFVPYNTYDLTNKKLKYADILDEGTINPKYIQNCTEYGLLRQPKSSSKHIYGKRVFYMDEDSWSILGEDSYDTRGNLGELGCTV